MPNMLFVFVCFAIYMDWIDLITVSKDNANENTVRLATLLFMERRTHTNC